MTVYDLEVGQKGIIKNIFGNEKETYLYGERKWVKK